MILLLVYQATHVKAPPYISGLLKAKPAGRYHLRSDSQDLLTVPRTMFKTLGDRAFAKAGPSLWNELPVDIRGAASVGTFKSQLKTFLFESTWQLTFYHRFVVGHIFILVFNCCNCQ